MVGVGCREYRQSSEELFSESSDEVREPDVRLERDGTADIAGLLTWKDTTLRLRMYHD